MSDMTGAVAPGNLLPSREKYWSELSEEGKIERMRFIIRDQRREMTDLKKQVNRLQNAFSEHEHMEGKLYTPVRLNGYIPDYPPSSFNESLSENPDQVWF